MANMKEGGRRKGRTENVQLYYRWGGKRQGKRQYFERYDQNSPEQIKSILSRWRRAKYVFRRKEK